MNSTIANLTKELEEIRIQHQDASSSLDEFNAKENSYRNEIKTIKQEMESLVNIKNQEIQSLKFEMSSAEMKYETAANVSFEPFFDYPSCSSFWCESICILLKKSFL